MIYNPGPRVDTRHVDLGNKFNNWGFSGVIIRAGNPELIKSTVVVSLRKKDQINGQIKWILEP